MLVACVVAWVFSSLVAVLMALVALGAAIDPGLVDEVYRQNPDLAAQPITRDSLMGFMYVMAGIVVVWAVAAIVLAVLAFRRAAWGRVGLLASAGGAGAVCLLAALQTMVMVAPLFACVVTFSLLLRPDVRAWFAAP